MAAEWTIESDLNFDALIIANGMHGLGWNMDRPICWNSADAAFNRPCGTAYAK